jgi:Di-haem oxidoreductase, putative peroxidase
MTAELQARKQMALDNPGIAVELVVQDGKISFGSMICAESGTCNYTNVTDLVVRPMGWKGSVPSLRGFSALQAFYQLSMQPDEVLWVPGFELDDDGVGHELSVGDITAMTLYLALQETPTTVIELADAGKAALSPAARAKILAGQALFEMPLDQGGIGCGRCHVSEVRISSTELMEPSPRAQGAFASSDLTGRELGYTPDWPLVVDLAGELADAPRVVKQADGSAVIRPYTDLKRHAIPYTEKGAGTYPRNASLRDAGLPDDADAESLLFWAYPIEPNELLTPELWGVGSTGPWLHDGRASTLREAILLHGAASQGERDAFDALSRADQGNVIAFLRNLVLVELDELAAGSSSTTTVRPGTSGK